VLVPVIRSADKKIVERIDAALQRTRRIGAPAKNFRRTQPAARIATVTNYGTFGLIWATPIPLPEQTLVLGMARDGARRIGTRQKNQFRAGDGSEPHFKVSTIACWTAARLEDCSCASEI